MKNNVILLDILFYLALPLFVWHVLRDYVGDYYAMLLTSVPGIIYTLYRFNQTKKLNVTGTFILASLVIGTVIDLLSGSALRLLWNNVYYSLAMGIFFLATMLFKRPLALYFALDVAELQGYDRKFSKHLYYHKPLLLIFQGITLILAFRSGLFAGVNSWLILEYGVEAFDKGILLKQVLGWVITAITVIGFFYVGKVIQDSPELIKKVQADLSET